MKTRIGVMGSAESANSSAVAETARSLGLAIAGTDAILLTGATTGVIHLVGKTARDAGALHIGISPGENQHEHTEVFGLPADACDAIIYTGFGLIGRNVVLVRSCDVVIFIAGSIGSLNEFTIAYDEGKVIGCLPGTGGVADQVETLSQTFQKKTRSRILHNEDPRQLIAACLKALEEVRPRDLPINTRG